MARIVVTDGDGNNNNNNNDNAMFSMSKEEAEAQLKEYEDRLSKVAEGSDEAENCIMMIIELKNYLDAYERYH